MTTAISSVDKQQSLSSGSPASPPSFASHSSSSSQPSASTSRSSASRAYSNLPPPPPTDRIPPPKGRSMHHASQKFKLLKKGKDRGRREAAEDDDGWTLEGGPVNAQDANGETAREIADLVRPLDAGENHLSDSQLTEVPREDRRAKGRSLAKKTSQLFGRRDKDRGDAESSGVTSSGQLSLALPGGSRQASYSSITSNESSTNGSSRHFPALTRPISLHARQKNRSPNGKHSRRPSQDSQTSWHGASRSIRSGSTSTYNSPIETNLPTETNVPIPHRQPSHLSASVPALSRQALPLPPPSSGTNTSSIPSRMSSWFSNLLPNSAAAPVERSTSPDSNPSSSPARKQPFAAASFLNAARQKAVDGVRQLLDSEAQPDKCPDTIWVLGVGHPGYRPSAPSNSSVTDLAEVTDERRMVSTSSGMISPSSKDDATLRPAAWPRTKEVPSGPNGTTSPPSNFGQLFTASTVSLSMGSPSKETDGRPNGGDSPSKAKKDRKEKEVLKWPEHFYDDFRSRVWCTYRSQYAPILSLPPSLLIPSPDAYYAAFGPPADISPTPPAQEPTAAHGVAAKASSWGWSRSAEERGLTSDAGWGCMLRTGQSMLANALIHLQLGRDWRLPMDKPSTTPRTAAEAKELESYAQYVRLMSWFLDDPSPLCPFSVHRMALIGKELGKEVGEWFGPSTAAGALKTLTNSFPLCGLAVVTATDSMVYKSDVYAASNLSSEGWTDIAGQVKPRRPTSNSRQPLIWGDKAVLILIGLRLGLDGVNPIYYDSIKALFTFPQSVGIAGGRPSSSYYFVASQAGSLFYLDPHITRAAIPLEIPPVPTKKAESPAELMLDDEEAVVIDELAVAEGAVDATYTLDVVNVDDLSSDSESSLSPTRRTAHKLKAAKRLSAPPRGSLSGGATGTELDTTILPSRQPDVFDDFTSTPQHGLPAMARRPSATPSNDRRFAVDPETAWYAAAYSTAQLRTFHCEKVKKMPLSGLDPSMLLGFLCRDEAEFEDFCERAVKLPQKIFSIQDEPPIWDEDDDAGLESVSEPDVDELSDIEPPEEEEEVVGAELAGSNSAVAAEPVDIPHLRSLKINTSDITSAKYGKPAENEEADWDETIAERSDALSSQPVLVSRGFPDMPINAIPRPNSSGWAHGGKPVVPELGRARERMESWVQPEKEGQAPNGGAMGGALLKYE